MNISKLALALVVLMPATGAIAQDYNATANQGRMSAIEVTVDKALDQYNINADASSLTQAQLTEIVNIMDDPSRNSGGSSAKSSIEAALRRS